MRGDARRPTPPRPSTRARLARAEATFHGGPIVASTGETVDVRVSDALPAETATPEGWAEFLAGLIHGPELSQLTTVRRDVRRGAGHLWHPSPRLLRTRISWSCPVRRRSTRRRRDRPARVRPPHRVSPLEPSLGRHRLGPEALGERRERLRARRPARRPTLATRARTTRATRVRPGPRCTGSRTSAGPGSRPRRGRSSRRASSRTPPRSTRPSRTSCSRGRRRARPRSRTSSARRPPRSGGYRSRLRSTELSGSAPPFPSAASSTSRSSPPNRRTLVRRAQWVSQRVKRLEGSICGQRSLFVRVTETGLQGRVRVSVTTPLSRVLAAVALAALLVATAAGATAERTPRRPLALPKLAHRRDRRARRQRASGRRDRLVRRRSPG